MHSPPRGLAGGSRCSGTLAVTDGVPGPSSTLPCSLWRVDESSLLGTQHPFLIAELVNQAESSFCSFSLGEQSGLAETRGGIPESAWAVGLQTGPGALPDAPARRAEVRPPDSCLRNPPGWSASLPPRAPGRLGPQPCCWMSLLPPLERTLPPRPTSSEPSRPMPGRAAGRRELGVCGETMCPPTCPRHAPRCFSLQPRQGTSGSLLGQLLYIFPRVALRAQAPRGLTGRRCVFRPQGRRSGDSVCFLLSTSKRATDVPWAPALPRRGQSRAVAGEW